MCPPLKPEIATVVHRDFYQKCIRVLFLIERRCLARRVTTSCLAHCVTVSPFAAVNTKQVTVTLSEF